MCAYIRAAWLTLCASHKQFIHVAWCCQKTKLPRKGVTKPHWQTIKGVDERKCFKGLFIFIDSTVWKRGWDLFICCSRLAPCQDAFLTSSPTLSFFNFRETVKNNAPNFSTAPTIDLSLQYTGNICFFAIYRPSAWLVPVAVNTRESYKQVFIDDSVSD